MPTCRYFYSNGFIPHFNLISRSTLLISMASSFFSAILGAVSHVFWDSFTHNDAFFVRNLHIYQEIVVPFQGVQYPLFYALQHISTYVGLTILIFYVFLMPVDLSFEPSKPRLQYWLLLAFLGSILFALRFVFTPRHFNLGNAVVTAVSALTLSMCILGYSRMFRPAAPQNSEP